MRPSSKPSCWRSRWPPASARGRAPTEISFYYPIAVGGPVARGISRLVEDFEREHPAIKVQPIYTGTYKDSIAKALTAHRSGKPPDLAVLFAVDIFTLIDADAIVPFDDLVDPVAGQAWLQSFYPALMANSRAAGKTGASRSSAPRSSCTGTSRCSATRGWTRSARRKPGPR